MRSFPQAFLGLAGAARFAMLAANPRIAMKPQEFLDVLDHPEAPAITARGAESELLLTVVAHLFFADRALDERELKLVSRLAADVPDVRAYVEELASRKLDYALLAATFPDPKDRDDIITLAEHAVWGDDTVDSREWDVVDQLVESLGVERD